MLPCHAMPPSQPDEVEIAFSVVDKPFTRPCLMTLDAQNLPSREHLRSTRKRTAVSGILEICTTGWCELTRPEVLAYSSTQRPDLLNPTAPVGRIQQQSIIHIICQFGLLTWVAAAVFAPASFPLASVLGTRLGIEAPLSDFNYLPLGHDSLRPRLHLSSGDIASKKRPASTIIRIHPTPHTPLRDS